MRHLRRLFAALLAIAVLSGCGGGGNSGPPPPSIEASSPPAGTTGAAYAGYKFTASGGTPPFTWTASGSLPSGLTLSASGQLSGTPATAGTYHIMVTATDSSMPPLTASTQVSLQVNDSAITVAPASPPAGAVNYSYPGFAFSASGGSPPYTWKASGPLPPGLALGSSGGVSGTPTQVGIFAFSVIATDSAQTPMSSSPLATQIAIGPSASFTATGSMKIGRSGHAATLLISGKVLVTGGGNGTADPTAELYDPASGTFNSAAANMTEPRIGHTATLLKLSSMTVKNYGKVLIVGSEGKSAELYDPVSSTFAITGSMHHARTSPTATLLNTGEVLIVGGNTTAGDLAAELYDPSSGAFSDTGSTTMPRTGHTATLLQDGSVLIAGGTGTATAELYDPTHGTFTLTAGAMTEPRDGHTATLLGTAANAAQSGYVLIIGSDGSADLYNPDTQTFASALPSPCVGPPHTCTRYTASLRNDGTVLVAGGYVTSNTMCGFNSPFSTARAALFAPEGDGFIDTGSLHTARDTHTATVLQDGTVLVVGGMRHWLFRCKDYPFVLSSAELFK